MGDLYGPGPGQPGGPGGPPLPGSQQQSPEMQQLMQQLQMQQQQNAALSQSLSLQERLAKAAPKQNYSPVRTNAETGQAELRPEFQLSGPENYIQQQLLKQGQEEATARDTAAQSLSQGLAQGRANMAMRGGLRSGAQASLQRQGLKELMASRQGVSRQGALDRANIGLQGEEMGRKTQAYNIENMLKGGQNADQFGMDIWKINKAAEAAEKSANATRAASQASSKK
jgi:hypothetical protein